MSVLAFCAVAFRVIVVLALSVGIFAYGQSVGPIPNGFEIGRHTFIDVGPPNDFYELLLVRPTAIGSSVERITLTPAADECIQPAKVEVATGSLAESVAGLFGGTDPCKIPEKELRRERKRCKHCLVFSGANVVMRVQCGNSTRIIRADILDRDMFDPAPDTPAHTSWTMRLLSEIDGAMGPGVLDRPMFAVSEGEERKAPTPQSEALRDISAGKYDVLFKEAPDKPSDLYRAAQIRPPMPAVRLLSSAPFQPENFIPPDYPPLARLARIQGAVTFMVDVNPDGSVAKFNLVSGHRMLQGATEKVSVAGRFQKRRWGREFRRRSSLPRTVH